MFDNIGEKLISLAIVFFGIGVISSIVAGVVCFCLDMALVGVVVMAVGSLVSWLSCAAVYTIGELHCKVCRIERELHAVGQYHKTSTVSASVSKQSQEIPMAKKLAKDSGTPFVCGACGKEGPYNENCPNCGSSLKRYLN